jgi:hypothetical protein
MQRRRSNVGTPLSVLSTLWQLCAVLVLCLGVAPRARADATLLLEEPYSYDGAFAGTGHAAVYLNHVCAQSPVELRPCASGEDGVVLSRYKAVGGYDWIAIPLVPYLFAVDQREDIPLFADAKLVAFLRDQYRRKYLESLAPDRPDGGIPPGDWYELVGSAYDRTSYAFKIETSAQQDAALIAKLNSENNSKRYSFIKHNCADFAREVVNFYYPHALHRSVIGDLGVTTPKQIAKMLAGYTRRHPELTSSDFVIPQVPGTIRRSKPVHGVLESVLTAKKYMMPMFLLHPYISGSVMAAYLGHGRFNPARHALVLDSSSQLDAPMTTAERRSGQSRLEELSRTVAAGYSLTEGKNWEGVESEAVPALDSQGQPVMRVNLGAGVEQVGIARANILSASDSPDLAAKLVEARLRQELRRSTSPKTALSDVAGDLSLLQHLLGVQPREAPTASSATTAGRTQVPSGEE